MHDVPAAVDFHFDVMCPWAYRTSIWMREVRDRAGVDVTWRFFSLEEVNREDGKPHPWERPWSYGWSLLRIAARLNRDDHELVDRWYERAGRALHAERTPVHDPDVARTLLAEIGVDPRVLDEALEDPTTHDDVRRPPARPRCRRLGCADAVLRRRGVRLRPGDPRSSGR
ncbi:MAG: DsbA family protein [Ilumatobacteraceae bacterium]